MNVNVVPMANSSDRVYKDNLHQLFTKCTSLWQYAGLYCVPNQRTKWKRSLQILYTILIQVIIAMNLRYAMIFGNMNKVSGSLMFAIAFFSVLLGYVYRGLLLILPAGRTFRKYVEQVHLYCQRHGYSPYMVKLNKVFLFVEMIVVLQGFVFWFVLFISPLLGSGIPITHFAPCDRYKDWTFWVCYPIVVIPPFIGLLVDAACYPFTSYTEYMLSKEYSRISEDLTKLVLEKTSFPQMDIAGSLETLRKRHRDVCGLLDTVNIILQHSFFATYASCLPAICVVVYSAIHGSEATAERNVAWFLIVDVVFGMLIMTISGALVHVKAHQPSKMLMNMDITKLNDTEYHVLHVFLTHLQSVDIGFCIYGMFTVTPSTILMIAGTVITYSVVALQIT